MNDEVTEVEIKAVKRPKVEELPEPVQDYIHWLEERQTLLEQELEAKPGAEARGITYFDVFGRKTLEDGSVHEVKMCPTQRSDVDLWHSFQLAVLAAQRIRGEYSMTPYLQSMIPTARKGNGNAPKPEAQPEAQPESEGRSRSRSTGGGRRRNVDEAEPSKTKSEQPIGEEQWIKVKEIELVKSMDGSQKYLRVKCGRWHVHGVPAYFDTSNIPADVIRMIEDGEWTLEDPPVQGKELQEDFADMQWVLVNPQAEHVQALGFAETNPT